MINTLPENNRTGYCYDKLKRFRQWDTAKTYISSFFSTLLVRRCHMRSAFLPALCIIRRKFPICISISILLLSIRLVNTAVSLQSENHLLQCENIAPSVPLH